MHDLDLMGCNFVVLGGVVLGGILIVAGLPVSLFCTAAGLIAYSLGKRAKSRSADDERLSIWRRLGRGLVSDTSTAAWLVCFGLAAIWLIQIYLNLFGTGIDPAAVAGFELGVLEFADKVDEWTSPQIILLCLGCMIALSLATSALWPLIRFGHVRTVLSATTALLTAFSSFSFVTADTAAGWYDETARQIRANIAAELVNAARARREHAAYQWISARLADERIRSPQTYATWRRYFQTAARSCGAETQPRLASIDDSRPEQPSSCESPRLMATVARARINFEARSLYPYTDTGLGNWLPDYASVTRPAHNAPFAVSENIHRADDLARLRARARQATASAQAARDVARGALVESVADLLSPELRGLAGDIVSVWRDSVLNVLSKETASRIGERLRFLTAPFRDLLSANGLVRMAADTYPIESAHVAAQRYGSVDAAITADTSPLRAPRPTYGMPDHLTDPLRSPNWDSPHLRGARPPVRPPVRPPPRFIFFR
jgi:hypothetical protein